MNALALLIMATPAGVAVCCGALAALWTLSHQVRSLIQYFAAGSLFMYALKLWTEWLEGHASGSVKGVAIGLLVPTYVDLATDGFIIARLVLFGGFSCSGRFS